MDVVQRNTTLFLNAFGCSPTEAGFQTSPEGGFTANNHQLELRVDADGRALGWFLDGNKLVEHGVRNRRSPERRANLSLLQAKIA